MCVQSQWKVTFTSSVVVTSRKKEGGKGRLKENLMIKTDTEVERGGSKKVRKVKMVKKMYEKILMKNFF